MLPSLPAPQKRRRQHARTALALPGQLYLLAEQTAQSCTITDISAGGVRIACEDVPPISAFVILHVEGFGRFEAVTANFRDNTLGLRFLVTDGRRARLARQIKAFLVGGVASAARTSLGKAN